MSEATPTNAGTEPFAGLLLALSDILGGQATEDSRKKLIRATRRAEKALIARSKELETPTEESAADSDEECPAMLIDLKTASAMRNMADILQASRHLIAGKGNHQSNVFTQLPLQILWHSSVSSSNKPVETSSSSVSAGTLRKELAMLLFCNKSFRQVVFDLVHIVDQIVTEPPPLPSRKKSRSNQGGEQAEKTETIEAEAFAKLKLGPILQLLAVNPRWITLLKHAFVLSTEIESLTGLKLGGPTADLISLMGTVAEQLNNDKKLSKWVASVEEYMNEIKDNPTLATSAQFAARGEQLAANLLKLQCRLKRNTDLVDLFGRLRSLIAAFRKDDNVAKFYNSTQRLMDDLTYVDRYKRVHLDTDVLANLKTLLLPELIEQLKMIKLPHLEGEDEFLKWSVDGAVVDTRGILPEHIVVSTETSIDVTASTKKVSSKNVAAESTVNVTIARFDAIVKDAVFSFKRKTWPRLRESGVANVMLIGVSITTSFRVKTSLARKALQFSYLNSSCSISKMKLKLNDTKHDGLYNTAISVLRTSVRAAVELSITENIGLLMGQLIASANVVSETGTVPSSRRDSSTVAPPALPKRDKHINEIE